MKILSDHITIDKNIQFGKPVCKGSRVAVQCLFWHLEKGISLDSFLEDFPGVNKTDAEAVIERGARRFETSEIILDETVIR